MSEELKRCPFCGGQINMVCGTDGVGYVFCGVCNAEGPLEKSKEEAVAAWNRRANEGEGHDK